MFNVCERYLFNALKLGTTVNLKRSVQYYKLFNKDNEGSSSLFYFFIWEKKKHLLQKTKTF